MLPPLTSRAIVSARGPRLSVDPERPGGFFVEKELTADRELVDVATILLTNRECPFRCLVCDLWKHTTEKRVAAGAVTRQIQWALDRLPATSHLKLYNAGSFFDVQAVSRQDREEIAGLVGRKKTLVVECHPKLVNSDCIEFAQSIAPAELQVAMGLETVDPDVLSRLNKGMTLEDFEAATRLLLDGGVAVRAFILLGAPGHFGTESVLWAKRSVDYAQSLGVESCVVIPVRSGNGIVNQLEREGFFVRPTLEQLEEVVVSGIQNGRGRVLADLWDIESLAEGEERGAARVEALRHMNLTQQVSPSSSRG
ncbi:MAG: radical SAM protein [bacterium]|nr:radical SAM protein [bacterium]